MLEWIEDEGAQALVLEAQVWAEKAMVKMLPRVFEKIDVDGNGALLYV